MTPPEPSTRRRHPRLCQAESVWTVGENMDGMWNIVGGERGSEPVRVLWRHVLVFGCVPKKERWRGARHQCVECSRPPQFRRGIFTQEDQTRRPIGFGLHR